MNPDYYQRCPAFKFEETEEGCLDGMEVVRQEEEERTPPFHHILTEQAKSLIALQELQNEVGALLEFREVVMEAFPQLRVKLRSRETGGGTGSSGSSGGSARWEPGVRVKRKPRTAGTASSDEPPRSRSNSRSSKAASGSSVIPDSGFCTKQTEPSEDELWTLLELIQAKGTRLRLEAETLRSRSLPHQDRLCHQDRLQALLQERERLTSRLAELEQEMAARAEEGCRLSQRVEELTQEKMRLESALAAGTPRLGTLDGIVSSPGERIICPSGVSPNKEVTAAILRENNPLELKRHLLTTTYENQVAGKKIDRLSRIKETLSRELSKFREENEDLKFQLEEKNIELEGTRARVRLLERGQQMEGDNSSTESAGQIGETPKRPRSRIPRLSESGSLTKPPRPPPLTSPSPASSTSTPLSRGKHQQGGPASAGRAPLGPTQNGGVEHDSLEMSRELDRSMRSEIVPHQGVRAHSLFLNHQPRYPGPPSKGSQFKRQPQETSPQYFDSIESKLDSDSLDMV